MLDCDLCDPLLSELSHEHIEFCNVSMLIMSVVIVVCCIFADNSVLDCIYSDVNRTYYVLDLMCWSSYPIYDSEVLFSATYLLFSCAFDVPHVMWSLYSGHTECGWMEAQCSIWAYN